MLSIRTKLALALLVTGLSGVLIIAVLAQQFTTAEFDEFVLKQERANFIADMAAYYEVYGSWDNMRMARGRLPIPPNSPDEPQNDAVEPPPAGSMEVVLVDQDGIVILPDKNHRPGQLVSEAELEQSEPIVVGNEIVGYVFAAKSWPIRDTLEKAYLQRINEMLLMATAVAVGLALVLSVLFSRSLSKPLQEIAAAIQSITRGHLEQQVPVRSRDEIGQVAKAVNQMSADLAQSNHLRRQMTADIAHELRTPLSVVVGYLESLSEGLLKPSPERFKIMTEEAKHLQHLVEDLRTLSLAEAGELHLYPQKISPAELLNLAAAAFGYQAEQRNITLSVDVEPDVPLLDADPDRILQVLSNLLSNALRHTPIGGQITLFSRMGDNQQIVFSIQDTGQGIPPEHLSRIFERFYRVDYQGQSESGLGLAIAKSIVEAHGGSITASSAAGSGTTFTLAFPANHSDKS